VLVTPDVIVPSGWDYDPSTWHVSGMPTSCYVDQKDNWTKDDEFKDEEIPSMALMAEYPKWNEWEFPNLVMGKKDMKGNTKQKLLEPVFVESRGTHGVSDFIQESFHDQNLKVIPHLGRFSHENPYLEYRPRASTCKLHFGGEEEHFIQGEDTLIIPIDSRRSDLISAHSFTTYKPVGRRVRPISGAFPQEALVRQTFPHNPLGGLPSLSKNPLEFSPTRKISAERLKLINVNSAGFLWPEEEKLFAQVMVLNEAALAFEETDQGTLHEDYFSSNVIPTIPHTAWEEKNIPVPPDVEDKVINLLKHKMDVEVYEHCQSAYCSKWFCVLKKPGKLGIVHDLQALNAVTIWNPGGTPILDNFVEPFAGRQFYTVFNWSWGFDPYKVHPASRDLMAFVTPQELLRSTSIPMGYTNSQGEFQKYDLPIKGPAMI
jgi:hypothetical protein